MLGVRGSAVIATRPAIAPFRVAAIFVWLLVNLLMIIHATTPPAAAREVLTKISATAVASAPEPSASCDPPLNPKPSKP